MSQTPISAAGGPKSYAVATQTETRVERVSFTSNGEWIVGELYLPAGVAVNRPAPSLVVTGAWMTVKEQMPARYAREAADRGLVALAFDFRGWGESGGSRRQYENPTTKIADIEAAVAYLASRPEVDANRIGGLGICASSGYMVAAAAETPAIKSVALVAPWLHDVEIVRQIYGGAEGVGKLEAQGDDAEAAYQRTGQQTFVPAASLDDARSIMFGAPYYTESDRGLIPAWRNEADPAFWRGWLAFDAIPAASRVTQPLLIVHSDAAAVPQGARRFAARLPDPPRQLWLDGVSQFEFYDRAAPVAAASDAVADHFARVFGHDDATRAPEVDASNSFDNLASAAVTARPATAVALDGPERAEQARNLAAVGRFLDLLQAENIEPFLDLLAEDARQDMPYGPPGFPPSLVGKASIAKQYRGLPQTFDHMRYADREFFVTQDPRVVIARFRGDIKLKGSERKYDNHYLNIFVFDAEGRIVRNVEHFNPLVLMEGKAFGDEGRPVGGAG